MGQAMKNLSHIPLMTHPPQMWPLNLMANLMNLTGTITMGTMGPAGLHLRKTGRKR
jgi:hypothetical protein